MAVFFGGARPFDRPMDVSIYCLFACCARMFVFDMNNGSVEWGRDQVMMCKNEIMETMDGSVSIELAPVFNKKDTPKAFVVSCCAAGMRASEVQVRVEHLQDNTDVLVVSGEGGARQAAKFTKYRHPCFQMSFALPRDVCVDSRTVQFDEGLLVVEFKKQQL